MGGVCCKSEIDFRNEEAQLKHFYLSRAIGKGSFGKVRIVRHKHTNKEYALKYIDKTKCIQRKAVNNVIGERRLLERINHPLIVNLRYAFQDDDTLYMALDLMLGGDLRFLLEREKRLSELQVRFYVAEISLSLSYLHRRRIAHRDIKPDNILLDDQGHAHLSDFNVAAIFTDKRPLRYSSAGTTAYMAPEILSKQGYSTTVDWWSLGVSAYELLFGERPFHGKTAEEYTDAVLHQPLRFPLNAYELVSDDCIQFLSGLLEKSPNRRLGCGPEGLVGIQSHSWFQGMDWIALERKQSVPPFKPDSKMLNFDAVHEIEEILLEDPPLRSSRKRTQPEQQQPCVTEEARWMQIMEERFLPFDYEKKNMLEQQLQYSAKLNNAVRYDTQLGDDDESTLVFSPTTTYQSQQTAA